MELDIGTILTVVRLANKEETFNEFCFDVTEDSKIINLKKAKDFFISNNLPLTKEALEADKLYSYKLQRHPQLKTKYTKGDYIVVSAGHILNSSDFIASNDRMVILEVLDDIEFETTITLTTIGDPRISNALRDYVDNHLVKIHEISGNLLYNLTVSIPTINDPL